MASIQSLGNAREVIVAGFLMLAGYNVSKPLSGASKYDLIVEKNGVCLKVQGKNLRRDPAYLSAVVHSKDGLRSNYYHSWSAFDELINGKE
ncbi:group I intron-associated PD-(D/E)XK endonuclease [Heliophilum fasciatum]|uniref:PD(D/E)XK endonuclease domain-containing protein n=1 Tax=Heliophilum fasciatum TaxID=35700 RepID=A0A4R2RKZ1_9FIRM|nr:group I intron-associated PD-(D/E)XK endonuclease [Heliophilum fasciatum]MCW2277860.1 hypothetical protein [Heliophilum fasciatum]TCP64570.1 hypothetical protein EDD73_109112 [Heliophilum fasciatum]